jgi:hypothetical protein
VGIDQELLRRELSGTWLDGLEGPERDEADRLLDEVVADWAREADPTPDPQAVLHFQREGLAALAQGRDAAGRLDALRTRVLTRRAEHLGAETFQLGRAILAGEATDPDARERGSELLRRAEELAAALKAVPPSPEADAARRELSDAVMEALYAVERKAMSARLAREAPGGAADGPPDVR